MPSLRTAAATYAAISEGLFNSQDIVESVLNHAVFDDIYSLIKCVGRRAVPAPRHAC